MTVNTLTDSVYEETEFVYFLLYKTQGDKADGNYAAYGTGWIKNTNALTASLSSSASSVNEGQTVTYTPSTNAAKDTEFDWTISGVSSASLGTFAKIFLLSDSSEITSFPGHNSSRFKNDYAFAAINNDGSVITWGDSSNGQNTSAGDDSLTNVKTIRSSSTAFAAIREDGSVVAWGNPEGGGDLSEVSSALDGAINVVEIYSTKMSFAALRSDGSVITWGKSSSGGK